MSNWLNDFLNSPTAKRIITANYVDRLRLKNEGRDVYSNINDALEDFAHRTGLNEMQKRALRRQVFIKMAIHVPQMNFDNDKMLFENGNAPAAILPGVKPGSEKAKALENTRKKPFKKLTDMTFDSQQNRDVEDNAQQKSPGSPDADEVVNSPSQASYKAGIVIEAADEWVRDESPSPSFKFVTPGKSPRSKGPGQQAISKERKVLEEIRELQVQIVHRFMKPGSVYSKPQWRDDLSANSEERLALLALQSQIEDLVAVRDDLQEKRKERDRKESVKHKVEENNKKFTSIIHGFLGVKDVEGRKKALKNLSPEGLQNLFDKSMNELGSETYRRPSQGTDPQRGDYVKCMVCDKHGKVWINNDNPGLLPFEHLETHADELLGKVEVHPEDFSSKATGNKTIEYESTEAGKYRQGLLDAYLQKFPGASLQSRDQELAAFMSRRATEASGELYPSHVATKGETKLNYTDPVLIGMILHQFNRYGVDPDDRTLNDLAEEVLEAIKTRLDDEFPNTLITQDAEGKSQMREINYLANKEIPFEALHRAFREEVGRITEEYRGTFSDFKPLTKRNKRRWTSTERRTVQKERLEELRVADIEQDLATELGHWPTAAELAKRISELDMIQVGISITGGRNCWNCGNDEKALVENKRRAINSATCSKCGVYREVLVKVDEIDWEQKYVIRDPNENDPGGPKAYLIYEDPDYIGKGPKAHSNSRFVHTLGRAEQEIRTRINEDKQPTTPAAEGTGTEGQINPIKLDVGTPVYSQQYKHGRVAYMANGDTWVAWEDPQYQRTVKLKDLKGEVINLQSNDSRRTGYYFVNAVDIKVEEENNTESVIVSLKSANGLPVVREWNNLGVLENDIPVATITDPKELDRIEYASRRYNRERVLMKVSQEQVQKLRSKSVVVDRNIKATQQAVKSLPLVSRINILKRKIKRSSLIKRLLGGAK